MDILDNQVDELFGGIGQDPLPQRLAHAAALQDQVDFPLEKFRGKRPNVPASFGTRHATGFFRSRFADSSVTFPRQFTGCLSHEREI